MKQPPPPPAPELINRTTGMHLRIERSPEDGAVDPLILVATYPPHGPEPPMHYHPRQHERFEVLAGEMRARIAGETRTYAEGATFEVPAGTPHAMWNDAADVATLRWETEPGLRTLELFRKLYELAESGSTNEHGVPGLLQSAVLAAAYRNELRLTRPHAVVQRLALAFLAPLGRALGYRAA